MKREMHVGGATSEMHRCILCRNFCFFYAKDTHKMKDEIEIYTLGISWKWIYKWKENLKKIKFHAYMCKLSNVRTSVYSLFVLYSLFRS